MRLFRRAYEALEEIRAGSIARKVKRHLAVGETLLDLGCGSCVVGDAVARETGARVFGLDRIAFRRRPVPLALYSGTRAPFRDGAFDAVLVAFVLHHAPDGGTAVLREARRLARRKVLILEDGYDTPFERRVIRVIDRVLNHLEDPRIEVPLLFRPTGAWLELFRELGLRAEAVRQVRTTPVLRTRQTLFVLEVAAR